MSEFYAFAGEHPFLTLFLAYLAAWAVANFRPFAKKESADG